MPTPDPLRARGRVRLCSTSTVTIGSLTEGTQIDGVPLVANDLVLLVGESVASKNGIYKATASGGTPARFSEYDSFENLAASLIAVAEGGMNAGTLWRCTVPVAGTIDITPIGFERVDDIHGLGALANELDDTQELGIYDPNQAGAWPVRQRRIGALTMTAQHLKTLITDAEPATETDDPGEFADLFDDDQVPLLIDGALRKIDPVALQQFVLGTPWQLDPTGNEDSTPAIQAKSDSLLVYATVATDGGQKNIGEVARWTRIYEPDPDPDSYLLTAEDDRTLIRCTSSDPFTVSVPNGALPAGFVCYVAQMGAGTTNLQKTAGPPISGETNLPRRFDALKLETSDGINFKATPIYVIGGSTCLLPAGVFKIDGPGLKLHPAINLMGQGMTSTVLSGAPTLAGTQDTAGNFQFPALLTIAARRHPLGDFPGDPKYSWQPTIGDLMLIGDLVSSHGDSPDDNVTGCLVENGVTDPLYPTGQPSTDGAAQGEDEGNTRAARRASSPAASTASRATACSPTASGSAFTASSCAASATAATACAFWAAIR